MTAPFQDKAVATRNCRSELGSKEKKSPDRTVQKHLPRCYISIIRGFRNPKSLRQPKPLIRAWQRGKKAKGTSIRKRQRSKIPQLGFSNANPRKPLDNGAAAKKCVLNLQESIVLVLGFQNAA
jgi:hypothetical protein